MPSPGDIQDIQEVEDLSRLRIGARYELQLMRAGIFDGSGPTTYTGCIEWVRTEPHHPEWGHVKLQGQDAPVRIDVDQWLEAHKLDDPPEAQAAGAGPRKAVKNSGAASGKITTADLVAQIEWEEACVRQIKQNVDSGDIGQDRHWEGYLAALRKTRELIREFKIVKQWMSE